MLLDAKLPVRFWEEAVITACYLRNRILIGPNGNTLEEAYSGKRPNIGHLRAYGYIAYVYVPKETCLKMDDMAIKACLIGYMPISRQYKLYEPEQGKIIVSIVPVFYENERLEWNWNEELIREETVPFDLMEAVMEPVRGQPEAPIITGSSGGACDSPAPISPLPDPRWSVPGDYGDTIVVDTGALDSDSGDTELGNPDSHNQGELLIAGPLGYYANAAIAERSIPRTYTEAINDPIYGAHWKQAISEELTKL
jgi:hypothetical protein